MSKHKSQDAFKPVDGDAGAVENRLLLKPKSEDESPWIALAIWSVIVAMGFAYVAIALCGRDQPFESGNNSLQDFLLLMAICFVVFFAGPRHNFVISRPVKWRTSLANLLIFGVPFGAALHWAYLGEMTGIHFSLTAKQLANLDARSLVAILMLSVLIATIFGYHIFLSAKANIMKRYLASFVLVAILVAGITAALRQSHFLHFHHYCVGLFLFPFCRFAKPLSLATQGFLLGVAVEGIARWGMDPLWYPLATFR